MTRIAIVEDNNIVRSSLKQLIEELPTCSCVADVGSAEEALRLLPRCQPDIIMMDIHLPNLSGIECTRRLKEDLPAAKVLIITVYEDEEKIFQALKAGASGYILKRSGPAEIISAIEEVLQGGAPMTSTIARKVVDSFREQPPSPGEAPALSRRETEILGCLSKGYANKEIADQLNITVDTVRWHLKQIYEKLHVHGRTEAAIKFLRIQGRADR